MKNNLLKTHFVVGTADIVENHVKCVGLPDVMLRKGLNSIAASVFLYRVLLRKGLNFIAARFFFLHGQQNFFERGPWGERG